MAYTEFYMQTTGSNLNAGSTNDNAASLTYASGNWVAATGVFTVASGDPVADGVTTSDWVSVYVNADTATPFVGKVTAVSTTTITVDITTNKIGTVPTDGTGTRNIKVGGAWADFGLCASGRIFNSTTLATVATRINIKAGTYANTSTTRTVTYAGSNTIPVWYRGYKTTIGDLDALPTTTLADATDIPLITFTTGSFATSNTTSSVQRYSLISVQRLSSGSNGTAVSLSGQQQMQIFQRCRFDNQFAGAASYAVTVGNGTGGAFTFRMCWFKATSTATRVISADTGARVTVEGCLIEGGGDGYYGARLCIFVNNFFKSVGGNGIWSASTSFSGMIFNNTFYGCGSDGIEITAVPTISSANQITIVNNIFESCLYGINNSSGTTLANIWHARNSFYNMTSGNTTGLGDGTDQYELTESASHFTNAGTGDFSLKSTSVAKGSALPQLFENNSNKSWGDLGAIQREEPTGGSGTNFFIPVE